MNELMNINAMTFDFNGTNLTIIIDENRKLWWVAKEICEVLKHTNPRKAVKDHCKHAKLLKGNESLRLGFNPRGVNIIPEGDLMRLVAKSKLPAAQRFEEWVFDEVLPEIRNTGSYYVDPNPIPAGLPNFRDPIAAAEAWVEAESGRREEKKKRIAAGKKIKKLEHNIEEHKEVLRKTLPKVEQHERILGKKAKITMTALSNHFRNACLDKIEVLQKIL